MPNRATCGALLIFGMAISSADAKDFQFRDVVGTWNSDATGENITISENHDVLDTQLGQGRANTTTEHAANFAISYQPEIYCFYYVTETVVGLAFANRNQGQPSVCLKGNFRRAIEPRQYSDIVGTWSNDVTAEDLTFREGNDVFDNRNGRGQGRIGETGEYAANYRISYQDGVSCW